MTGAFPAALIDKLADRKARVGVLGVGYVGLSLARELWRQGFAVVGYDPDAEKVQVLAGGASPLVDLTDEEVAEGLTAGVAFSAETSRLGGCDVFVICVPTPVTDGRPDLGHVTSAAEVVAGMLAPGSLVILESTTYPGTTEDLLRPILEAGSGLRAGEDFALVFSPERIDPANRTVTLREIPKIVGGLTPRCAELAETLYATVVDKVVRVRSPREAEMAKLIENTFRHVNIAMVNELAVYAHELGVDLWESIEAAATKPFGFMAFYPGPGVGGHCIGVDPSYLSWRVRRDQGHEVRFVELAHEVNGRMPEYVVGRISDLLNERGKAVRGTRILALGVAYKPETNDLRESPALKVLGRLGKMGAALSYHDPYVGSIRVDGATLDSAPLDEAALRAADLIVILTGHRALDYGWIADHAPLVFDTRNASNGLRRDNVVKL